MWLLDYNKYNTMKKGKDKSDYGESVRIDKEILSATRIAAKKNKRTIKGQIEKTLIDGLRNEK